MGKYGTNREGFGAFEGGVNADKGAPLVSTSSDGETALLFGPAALREIQAGVANGDFAIPPDNASAAISDENPLPYWTLSGNTSIAVTVENDATAASSNVLQFYNPSVSTDVRYLTRYIAIPGALDRSFSFYAELYMNSYSSGRGKLTYAWAKSDFTATGTGGSSGFISAVTSLTAGGVAPSDAAYMYITIEIQANASPLYLTLSEVRVNIGKQALYITDSNPTITPAKITSSSGVLAITPATRVKINGANSEYVARIAYTTTQSLVNNTSTKLLFNTASATPDIGSYDPNGWFNNANDSIDIGQDGFYCVTANAAFAANATGRREVAIIVNGTNRGSINVSAASAGTTNLSVSTNLYLVSGDQVTLTLVQTSGGALNTANVAGVFPALSVGRIGA